MNDELESFLNTVHHEICNNPGCSDEAFFCCPSHKNRIYCPSCNIALHSHCLTKPTTMPKIIAQNTIVLNSLLTPIFDYIHANKLKDEMPDIYNDLNSYQSEITNLVTNVLNCLKTKSYYKMHELNEQVINLKNKI